ncbi:hypothetical protein LPJ56_005810, partial [Coemansia sp. RSA 2599]
RNFPQRQEQQQASDVTHNSRVRDKAESGTSIYAEPASTVLKNSRRKVAQYRSTSAAPKQVFA